MSPGLPYQGAIKLRGIGRQIPNQDTHFEHTGAPTGQEETFPHEEYGMPRHSRKHTISDLSDLVSYPKKGNHNTPKHVRYTTSHIQNKDEETKPDNQSITNIDNQVEHILPP